MNSSSFDGLVGTNQQLQRLDEHVRITEAWLRSFEYQLVSVGNRIEHSRARLQTVSDKLSSVDGRLQRSHKDWIDAIEKL